MNPWSRLSLAQQFLLASFPIVLAGTLVVGWWIGRQVEDGAVHRIGGVTSLYVDSFIAPHLQGLEHGDRLSADDEAALAALLGHTPLGRKIVSFKIWRPDGRILFSTEPADIGLAYPVIGGLAVAVGGGIYSEVSQRTAPEQARHGQPRPRLIETYTPVHADHLGRVIAVAEFYQSPGAVDHEARRARYRSWLLVGATMSAVYLLLLLVVRRGSRTIVRQQAALAERLAESRELNQQNRRLHERVSHAAEQAISLNETFLKRVSADVHDGPGQDLGFALMQLKNLRDGCDGSATPRERQLAADLDRVQTAVQSAVDDLRSISSNLEMPAVGALGLHDVAGRAVRDFQAKTQARVTLVQAAPRELAASSLQVRIALYRLVQESLANALRHADAKGCKVELETNDEAFTVRISDEGPGFDVASTQSGSRLGLSGMRQRVEVLGGWFEVASRPGAGTTVSARLPLLAGA